MVVRAFLASILVFFTSAALAAEWVEFGDGRVLEVRAVRLEGPHAVLELDGGGELSVPAAGIVRRGVRGGGEGAVAEPAAKPRAGAGAAGNRLDPDWRHEAGIYAELIEEVAGRHGLEPILLASIARAESNFDPFAVSDKGACGFLQLLPSTAERFGVADVFDVRQNVEGGAKYLNWLLDRYEGDVELALAAYNAGEGAVDRHDGIPPYRETQNYVARVMQGAGLTRTR